MIKIFFFIGFLISLYLAYRINKILRSEIFSFNTRDLEERNFQSILLGSTKTRINTSSIEIAKTLNLSFFGRNLYASNIILEQMYSYLKENGNIVIIVDSDYEYFLNSKKINYPDVLFFHTVIKKIHGFKTNEIYYRFPVIFFSNYFFRYLLFKYFKRTFNKKVQPIKKSNIELINLKRIINFAYEKDFKLFVISAIKDTYYKKEFRRSVTESYDNNSNISYREFDDINDLNKKLNEINYEENINHKSIRRKQRG
jgi:hypothetical protein